jgi:hypothetical protein
MTDFIDIINTYLSNYSTYSNGMVEFECKYGDLTFYKPNTNIIIVHAIYILPEYRQTGMCRNILHYLLDTTPKTFKTVRIQTVLSKILYEYLLRFNYNTKTFTVGRYGFDCIL